MKLLNEYRFLIPLALLMGLAPFIPEPHIAEKVKLIFAGQLHRPLDMFDLLWHSWPIILILWKSIRDISNRYHN